MRHRISSFVCKLLPLGVLFATVATATPIAYMVTRTDHFGTIDLGTGVYTDIVNTGLLLSGLGISGGSLYAGLTNSTTLYKVDQVTGATTIVGSGSNAYGATGSTVSGLYGIENIGGGLRLFVINPINGATTLIGSTGLTTGSVYGVSTGSSSLYLANDTNLYTLNTSTGAATLVGSMGSVTLGGMVSIGGVLYGGVFTPTVEIATLNTSTGAAAIGPLVSGAQGNFYGLASFASASTPEPATFGLLLVGGALLAVGRGSRR